MTTTPAQDSAIESRAATRSFYRLLRREVMTGNPDLTSAEQERLRQHYPVMMAPERFPPELVTTIYVNRRAPAVDAIAATASPVILDAGCGYGSESFLFAVAGAEVVALDHSAEQIAIARRRQRFFEEAFGRRIAVQFIANDLDTYTPERSDLSLTWLASVLAVVVDQEALLRRVCGATRAGGEVMVTDMNLSNPLFLLRELRRRRRLASRSDEFARAASTFDMVLRRGRSGARYFRDRDGGLVDDAQFFLPRTLARLLQSAGFSPEPATFSGFVPPALSGPTPGRLERLLTQIPALRRFGYFYLMRGRKPQATIHTTGEGAP